MEKEIKNKLVIWFYFLSSYIILNNPFSKIPSYALSIALIIAGTYGIVCLHKKTKFLF